MRSRSSPVSVEAMPTAGAQVQALALEHDRRRQDVEQASDERLDVGDVQRQHGELVAAQPRDGVALAQGVAQPLAADLQQAVAGGVPERVVDALEVVEVEEGDDGGRAVEERGGDPLLEQRAVGQAGQRVLEGEVAEVAVGGAAAGGAVEQAEQGGDPEDEREHDGDGAEPGDAVAADRQCAVALRGMLQRGLQAREAALGHLVGVGGPREVAAAQQRQLLPDDRTQRGEGRDGRRRLATAVELVELALDPRDDSPSPRPGPRSGRGARRSPAIRAC